MPLDQCETLRCPWKTHRIAYACGSRALTRRMRLRRDRAAGGLPLIVADIRLPLTKSIVPPRKITNGYETKVCRRKRHCHVEYIKKPGDLTLNHFLTYNAYTKSRLMLSSARQ
jgi:hypothetical protein